MASNQNPGPNLTDAPVVFNAPETTQVTSKLGLLPIELQRKILDNVRRMELNPWIIFAAFC